MSKTLNVFAYAFVCLLSVTSSALCEGDIAPCILNGQIFDSEFHDVQPFKGEQASWIEKDVSIRFPKPGFTIGKLNVGETICTKRGNKVSKLVFSIYNRGDDGRISDEDFVKKLKCASDDISQALNKPGVKHNRKTDPTRSSFDIGGILWDISGANVLLEYSVTVRGAYSYPTPEYIRLTVTPKKTSERSPQNAIYSRRKLNQNVVKAPNGVCEIVNIPMVDQGAKGYCAAAATARIMSYFGYEQLDQHQIAQWAQTESGSGTSNEVMMKGIRRVLHDKYKLVISDLESMDIKDLEKIVDRYNSFARKKNKNTIEMQNEGVININYIFSSFDKDILRESRTYNAQRNEMWFKKVKSCIDKGIPVLWSVQLGIIPEAGIPQSGGGHMRLITGYGGISPNDRYIIYSDSWGAGHERKSMPLKDAIAITIEMKSIAPKLNM